MSRIALFNLVLGFFLIFLSSLCGVFLVYWTTESYVFDAAKETHSWSSTLLKSAHGHTNLFGMIHILYGLSLHFSKLSNRVKRFQTFGLSCGSFAMGVLLVAKSFQNPTLDMDIVTVFISGCLSLFFVSFGTHVWGLSIKLFR